MNDALELKWGFHMFSLVLREWAAQHSADPLAKRFEQDIFEDLKANTAEAHYLASCFSEDGDMLSQWRAYADDAKGFAVGFDNTAVSILLKVCYDPGEQWSEISAWLDDLFRKYFLREGEPSSYPWDVALVVMYGDLAAYKNQAFQEEREVRAFRRMRYISEPGVRRLRVEDFPEQTIDFAIRHGVPIPYMDYEFPSHKIREVVIGPRNPSTPEQISVYLNTKGIEGVAVRKSAASLR